MYQNTLSIHFNKINFELYSYFIDSMNINFKFMIFTLIIWIEN